MITREEFEAWRVPAEDTFGLTYNPKLVIDVTTLQMPISIADNFRVFIKTNYPVFNRVDKIPTYIINKFIAECDLAISYHHELAAANPESEDSNGCIAR